MVYKYVAVIDDVGDVFEEINGAFEDDLEIKITHVGSDFDSLGKSIKRDTYMILINETDLKTDLDELTDFIKNSLFLTVPVMVMTHDEKLFKTPPKIGSTILNIVLRPFDITDLAERLRYALEVFEYNRDINDITGLPGNKIISSKLMYELSQNSRFAFIFLDLDRFKEFGEYYGLYRGSQVMYFLTGLIDESNKKYGSIDDFVGNVGGDDFIMILKNYKFADKICDDIIARFDEGIVDFYDEGDLKNGYIEAANRDGEMERIDIMSISVVVMNYVDFKNRSFDEAFRIMNRIKKEAKSIDGSVVLKS